jgi:hypothetical protein
MKSPHLATKDPEVEVFDWVSPLGGSRFVSNVARAHILVSLFDGDPQKWLEFIGRDGTEDERMHDIPFLREVTRRIQSDPSYLPRLKDAMRQLSSILE